MKIGIIRSGKIGGTTAKLFAAAGHGVAISNSRAPASLAPLVEQAGSKAHPAALASDAGIHRT